MTRKLMATLIMGAVFAFSSMAFAMPANDTSVAADKAQQGEIIHVGVQGMVCDFCAQSLKKVFKKQDSVRDIDVSLEKKLVTVYLQNGKTLDDAVITKMITDAGYNIGTIHHVKAQ